MGISQPTKTASLIYTIFCLDFSYVRLVFISIMLVTWRKGKRPICQLNQYRRSSLKLGVGGGYVAASNWAMIHFLKCVNLSHSSEEL